MQQLSEGSVHRAGKQRSPGCSWSHSTPVASYCFLTTEVVSSNQTGSKLMNKYEISSQIISKDYVCVYIPWYLGVYVCYLRLLAATALYCTDLTECFDSCRLSGCWKCSVQKSLDTSWKSFGFWLVGGGVGLSVGRICLFLEIALSLINMKAQKTC